MAITCRKWFNFFLCVIAVTKIMRSNTETYVIDTLNIIGRKMCENICKDTMSCMSIIHSQLKLRCYLLGSSDQPKTTASNNTLEGPCLAKQRSFELQSKNKVCIVTDCEAPSEVSPSTYGFSFPVTPGSMATYICRTGYIYLDGTTRSTCLTSGAWSQVTLQCGAMECSDILRYNPTFQSGVYNIHPTSEKDRSCDIFCDMETDGGGWMVVQRRSDGSENFQRDYIDYQRGFGDLNGEYWFGNDALHEITEVGHYHLRVEMETFSGDRLFAKYTTFYVGDEISGYKLNVSGFESGNAGDSMSESNGASFSTADRNQGSQPDHNCAKVYSPFWHNFCTSTSPNGNYKQNESYALEDGVGIDWVTYRGAWGTSLKKFAMMIRSTD